MGLTIKKFPMGGIGNILHCGISRKWRRKEKIRSCVSRDSHGGCSQNLKLRGLDTHVG